MRESPDRLIGVGLYTPAEASRPREETCWARKQEISEAAAGMSARTLSGIKAKARIAHLDLSDHARLETSPVLVAVARDLAAIA